MAPVEAPVVLELDDIQNAALHPGPRRTSVSTFCFASMTGTPGVSCYGG